MRLSGQLQVCLFIFFYEKTLSVKYAPKRKQTILTLLEVFVRAKNCCLYCLVFACFCFVSWFLLVTCFCAINCPDNLIYYTIHFIQRFIIAPN